MRSSPILARRLDFHNWPVPEGDEDVRYESKVIVSLAATIKSGSLWVSMMIREVAARFDARPWLMWKGASTMIVLAALGKSAIEECIHTWLSETLSMRTQPEGMRNFISLTLVSRLLSEPN